jgi:type IV secretion system protein VirD4
LMLPTSFGVRMARVGPIHVWSSLEDAVGVFGGPRTGKTAWMMGALIDFPCAALVTSTRLDIYEQTRRFREKHGPVYVFNPSGLAGLASDINFDPLTGCKDIIVAGERAADMISAVNEGGGKDHAWWAGKARSTLTVFLHAAALGDRHMRDVSRWVADPDNAKAELGRYLGKTSPAAWEEAKQFIDLNTETRSSITSAVRPALEWLLHPHASAAAAPGGTPFDIRALLAQRATVYLIGREEASTAPLLAALTGHIAREARRAAAGRRLDPGLGLFLDEAANICPVPLASWTSDFGGSGMTIVLGFQSRAQMMKRWGAADAAVILNNIANIILLGGTKDDDDLKLWSSYFGERLEMVPTRNKDGKVVSTSTRPVPVFPPSRIGKLPRWRAIVSHRDLPPCIARVRPAWKRWDVHYADGLPGTRMLRAGFALRTRLRIPVRTRPAVFEPATVPVLDLEPSAVDDLTGARS